MREILNQNATAKSANAVKWLSVLAIVPLPITILWYITEGRGRWMSWWYFSPTAFPLGTLMLMISATAAVILSRMVRRITSLPVSYLDEREKQVRGNAYFATYKTLAKIAAVTLLVAAIYGLLTDFGVMNAYSTWVVQHFSTPVAGGGEETTQFGIWLSGLSNPFDSAFGNAMVYGGIFFFLLWILPIIKIAKLEARNN